MYMATTRIGNDSYTIGISLTRSASSETGRYTNLDRTFFVKSKYQLLTGHVCCFDVFLAPWI